MNYHELQELRRERWRMNGQPVRTLDDARAFLESVGFVLFYPSPRPLPVPTFLGAYAGSDESLPSAQKGFADPRAREATELMVRMLRERSAYEASFGEGDHILLAASVFPYFYALTGDRTPRKMPKPGTRSEYSTLARDVFNAIQKHGAMSKPQLSDRLGGSLSDKALDRALHDLWLRLRITRVDHRPEQGVFWDVLLRWSPEAVREAIEISVPAALSAMVSKYVDAAIAVTVGEVEEFFSAIASRAKVRDAVNALLSAREFTMVQVGNQSMMTVAARQRAAEKLAHQRSQPIARRPRPGVRCR